MAMQNAVITTSIGAEGIQVKTGENIMIADDPQSFIDKTLYLINNSKDAIKMGQAARKTIERYYTWSVIGRNMDHIYQSRK